MNTPPKEKRCPVRFRGDVQCCLEKDHKGTHLYKCEGAYCPGYDEPRSVGVGHPYSCVSGDICLETEEPK